MDAERAALADYAVEQHGSSLRHAIFFREEFLEFVDHQERAGNLIGAAGAFVARHVLNAEFAEKIATPTQFGIDPFKDAQAELAIALDGNDASMWQTPAAITFELDAFLEIDQIELDLLRAAPQRKVRDHDVEQCGFAGTSFACDERMLARALANCKILEFRRARTANWHAQFFGCLFFPDFTVRRRDLLESDREG